MNINLGTLFPSSSKGGDLLSNQFKLILWGFGAMFLAEYLGMTQLKVDIGNLLLVAIPAKGIADGAAAVGKGIATKNGGG